MSEDRFRPRYFAAPKGATLDILQSYGAGFAKWQRDVNFYIGDLARYAEARFPDTWHQAFPEWMSPGLVDRCKAVAKAYPNEEDRHHDCTWTQFMQAANKPDRQQLLAEIVEKGLTTDESRKANAQDTTEAGPRRWLVAIDCNYWLSRTWHSGAGVEAGHGVAGWIGRTVERLKEKGLTDVVCCFDSPQNHRKELTKEWSDRYKDRPAKDQEYIHQIQVLRDLLTEAGFRCVTIDGMEADDVLASYAVQFDGRVTLLAQDKDMRQCLSEKCNMLTDVDWNEDPTSGDLLPEYKWMSAKQHTEETSLRPDQWAEYQAIWGDSVDNIKGAPGIGEKGAKNLMVEFGSLDAILEAAKAEDERISEKQRKSLLTLPEEHPFADNVDVVRKLVTMRTDLSIPMDTRV